MEAEVVRDSLLHVAGELDPTRGRAGHRPQAEGLTSRRRSLYFAHHGEARMPFLELFDAANAVRRLPPDDLGRAAAGAGPANSELVLDLSRVLAGEAGRAATTERRRRSSRAAFEQVLSRAAAARRS